jgi:hypothetical protein
MRLAIKILTLLLSILSPLYTEAQNIAAAWEAMPTHILPTISKNARLDMIDLYNAGMSAKVATFTGDTACLTAMGNNYLILRTSKASTMQMMQIVDGKKLFYAIITTIEGPIANSHIDIYDEKWQPLEVKKFFPNISVADFVNLPKSKRKEREELLKKIPLHTIQYNMSQMTNDIIAIPSLLQTLDEETRKEIEHNFRKQIVLQWKGKKWKVTQ